MRAKAVKQRYYTQAVDYYSKQREERRADIKQIVERIPDYQYHTYGKRYHCGKSVNQHEIEGFIPVYEQKKRDKSDNTRRERRSGKNRGQFQ
jgi:hypothetical protein